MTYRHVFRVENLPDFKVATEIKFVVPPNAGSSFPVAMDFPENSLSNPMQLAGSPVLSMSSPVSPAGNLMSSGLGRPPTMYSSSMGLNLPGTSNSTSVSTLGSAFSPDEREVSAQSPSSPGHRVLDGQTMNQLFLPSISSGTPQSILSGSKTPVALLPRTTLSPQAQGLFNPVSPRQGSLQPGVPSFAPMQAPRSPTIQASQPMTTGQNLADWFATSPTSSGLVSAQSSTKSPTPTKQPGKPASVAQLSSSPSYSTVKQFLTSPTMLTPQRIQDIKADLDFAEEAGEEEEGAEEEAVSSDEGSDDGQEEEAVDSDSEDQPEMLPPMEIYKCSPAQDRSSDAQCQMVFPKMYVGGQPSSKPLAQKVSL